MWRIADLSRKSVIRHTQDSKQQLDQKHDDRPLAYRTLTHASSRIRLSGGTVLALVERAYMYGSNGVSAFNSIAPTISRVLRCETICWQKVSASRSARSRGLRLE